MSFKYRDHRELLDDSMMTVMEFGNRKELEDYLQNSLDTWEKGKHDARNITVAKYGRGIDERIGWDTHIVHLYGYGVLGFTDGPA